MAFLEYIEDTQQDFSQGTLNGVVPTATGNLELANTTALKFDGIDDYIDLGRPAVLNLTSAWTLEAWVKPTSSPKGAGVISEGYNTTENNVQYEIGFGMDEPPGGSAKLKVGFYANGSWAVASDTVDITVGQWVHIAGTWDGKTLSLYKNGNLVAQVTPTISPVAGSLNFYIGRRHDTAGSVNFFPGIIDEVRIWSVARTQADIQANMYRELTGTEAGLVGYWKLNEGSGTTAYDSTANKSNGTIYGATWTTDTNRHVPQGVRISPVIDISPVGVFGPSLITWQQSLPAGTSIIVETNFSLDGGVTWQGWQVATNGQPVPGIPWGADLSNGRLQIRETLSTTDTSLTPSLLSLLVRFGEMVDLPSSATVPSMGWVLVNYTVIPVGRSDLSSVGTVRQCNNLLSTLEVPWYQSLRVYYEVVERPKVTVAISPVADAYVLNTKPTMNFGDLCDLVVGLYDSSLARSLLRFDVSTIQPGLTIVKAVLRLSAHIIQGSGQVSIYEPIEYWDELGVTWYNQPGIRSPAESTAFMASIVELDITKLFLGWYKQSRANNGVVLVSSDEQNQNHMVIASREWPQPSRRPQLLVTYYIPDAPVGVSAISSSCRIIVRTDYDLPSTGSVPGGWHDLSSLGRVGRPGVTSIATIFQKNDFQSLALVRGTRTADNINSLGHVSRPYLLSSSKVRLYTQSDFNNAVYVLERSNLVSTGYVTKARNELPSTGIVRAHYNLSSTGSVRLFSLVDLTSRGYVAKARNELSSKGQVISPYLRSSGSVNQTYNMHSRTTVRIAANLYATVFIAFTGGYDLSSSVLPRIRDVSEILSTALINAHNSDLPCKGHVGPWLLEARITAKIWPPAGRSVM